jgi:hypothetical protein
MLMLKRVCVMILLSVAALAQTTPATPQSNAGAAATGQVPGTSGGPAGAAGDAVQMASDINLMQSLLASMQAQLAFVRDSNVRGALTSEAQMWSILLGDMQRRLKAQEQGRTGPTGAPHS